MRYRFFLVCLLLSLFAPLAMAQDDSVPRNAAIAAAQAVLGRRPNTWTYTIGQPTNQQTLGCPLLGGLTLDRQVIPYRYELVYNDGVYVVYASADGQITVLCDQKFFTPAASMPTPTVMSGIIATPTPFGPPATPTPNVAATLSANVGLTLTQYACPPTFAGYLPPRIRPGRATAAVEQGGVPNRLRSLPVADNAIAPQVGLAQPGRTLDAVLNGPACSGTFVWWYVEIDGIRGWTAESNAASNEYFLVPTSGNEVTPAAPLSAQLAIPDVVAVDRGFEFAPFVAFRGDAQAFFAYAYTSGNPTGQRGGTLIEYDATTAQQTGRLLVAPNALIVDLQVSSLGDLIVASNDQSIAVYSPDSLTNNPNQPSRPSLLLPNSFDFRAGNKVFAVLPSGTTLVSLSCPRPSNFGPSCDQAALVAYNLGSGQASRPLLLPPNVYVDNMGFSPDGRTLYVQSMAEVLAFDVATGQQTGRFTNADATFLMLDMAVNPSDGSILTTKCKRIDPATNGCALGEVALWASNGTLRGLLDSSAGNPLVVRYSPDGQTFLVGDSSGNMTLYSADGRPIRGIGGAALPSSDPMQAVVSIDDAAYSRDGRSVLFTTSDRNVYLWRIQP
jgi:hypothetical protein